MHPSKCQKLLPLHTWLETWQIGWNNIRQETYTWEQYWTCAAINIMPPSVYKLVFKDPTLRKLVPSKLEIGIYTYDWVKIVGACQLYIIHLDSKKLVETTFFVATNYGNVLLSCKSTFTLGLIQPRSRLDYLPPRASLITSSQDHLKKTRSVKLSVHKSQHVVAQNKEQVVSTQTPVTVNIKKEDITKLITSKEQILTHYPDVFERIGRFPGPPYRIQLDPSIPPKQIPYHPIPIHLKESLKKRDW